MAENEMYENLKKLDDLTKTNLSKQFENFRDFCESSINFANRCNFNQALKDIAFAELSAHRLREDASRMFLDGLITGRENIEITDLSTAIIFDGLSEEVTQSLIKSCECSKGGK